MNIPLSTSVQSQNTDLEWSLDAISQRERAKRFLLNFENHLCIYSVSVQQIYTNYSIHFPSKGVGKAVILPNPYAFHDTFHHIRAQAVRNTGLYMIPGETIGRSGVYMHIKYRSAQVKSAPMPLKHALARMIKSQTSADPFLPVVIKGDLREFNEHTPCLHLHRVKLSELTGLSQFERQNLQSAISDKLVELNSLELTEPLASPA